MTGVVTVTTSTSSTVGGRDGGPRERTGSRQTTHFPVGVVGAG